MDFKRIPAFFQWWRVGDAWRMWRAAKLRFAYEPALKSELYSAEQMERHGTHLARQHRLSERASSGHLLSRLAENEAVLVSSCEMLTAAAQSGQRVTPAAEWLLDNYFLIEEQIRTSQKHLPKGYSRELPRLANGPSAGLPRVYDIALETISHGDGRVDAASLARFVDAYQKVTPLTLGELWAIPIMLRLALIENLRRVATRVMADWKDRNLAVSWAERMAETAEKDPKSVVLTVADMARSDPPMHSSFVAEITRRLQGQSAALALPLTWIEQFLSESGSSIEHLVRMEAQQQAADQVSVSNSMGSLRLLAASDWRDFVESLSAVEALLRQDPAAVYANMDFLTRDHYRHVVERLARSTGTTESAVAQAAIDASQAASEHDDEGVGRHVGWHLIDRGLPALEQRLGVRLSVGQACTRLMRRAPLAIYLGCACLLTLAFAQPFLDAARENGWSGWPLAAIALLAWLATSRLAMGLMNWFVTLTVPPRMLPRLDFSHGVAASSRTLVVVPTLIASTEDVDALTEGLEVRYLANRDNCLHYALLTDFLDAPAEAQPEDDGLLRLARDRIEALNDRYPGPDGDRFFLFHRPRRWNAREQVWMGYERKRGKISELNALLRGHGAERFSLIVGDLAVLRQVRYVITLDTDTQLPRDAARQFVGAMAHPLNRPVYDPVKQRVTRGYGILQPRVGVSLPSTARSPYARLFGSDAGIDPYTRAVSDVYQDLFQEGSFIGKGIYDVDAFEQAIAGRFPDNRILSHDLVEGCYARAGLLSDVRLYEEYPAHYSADVTRRHRWIRGDWQLLAWIFPWAPTRERGLARNPLSALSRWKIFDNLRRSLVPMAFLAMLLTGWFGVAQAPFWTSAILVLLFGPPFLTSLLELLQKPHDVSLHQHLAVAWRSSLRHFARAILTVIWLPHEALYSMDAIVRTLLRMAFRRPGLLAWNSSREVERAGGFDLRAQYRSMVVGPLAGALVAAALLAKPMALAVAAPFVVLWLISPLVAWQLSQAAVRRAFVASDGERHMLLGLSRRVWAFFDTHVGEQGHWLAPDNIQEQPTAVVAHRTSPTNMGLALLGHLAAYDFGYLSAGRLLDRLDRSLATMTKLERFRGHFFNWYDTLTLQPLLPKYVSTVDSGNLAGHLLTLRPGLLALADDPVCDLRLLAGLAPTLDLLREALLAAGLPVGSLQPLQQALQAALTAAPVSLVEAAACSAGLLAQAEALDTAIVGEREGDTAFWLAALIAQCRDIDGEWQRHALAAPPGALAYLPTWRQLAALDAGAWEPGSQARAATLRDAAAARLSMAARLARCAGDLALMDFTFLYDTQRDLLTIGYDVGQRRVDSGFYDLLASEARLTNFVAIAQGQLPQESWFALGRLLTTTGGVPVLLSWSGSMFEYLMPMLVMPTIEGTLLDQTCRAAVARQIEYGHQTGLPWGVSESGYNVLDMQMNYQYRAFGVPGLGLKRGLGDDLVVAPYASALALMVAPEAACRNLERLMEAGAGGRFGLYEAIDYTPARLPRGQGSALIRSFMAHHQGMSLLALADLLLGQPMQRRFESDPQFQATMLLLQERLPRTATEYRHAAGFPSALNGSRGADNRLRVFTNPDQHRPYVQLLSNGRYHVMVSSAGGGYSRRGDLAVNRWHEDVTRDNWGTFGYLRDVESGAFWSTAHQPTLARPELYEAIFSDGRAEFRVRERDFDAYTEIVVSPEDDIELRRTRITNRARVRRTIEFTSYAEVVLAPALADAMHPAFSNLFVQTELVGELQAIIATRRPRAAGETVPWMCHLLAVHGADVDAISYETDRARFIGRGRSPMAPAALEPGGDGRLSNSMGSVLDPIVAIRCRVTLEPGQTGMFDLVTGVSNSRDGCMQLIGKYRDRHLADRVFDLAWTHSQVLLSQLNASLADARLYEQMAASILYAQGSLRAEAAVLAANQRNQSGLWGQSISGDLPIVLLQIGDSANIDLVRQVVQAHAYWRLKGLAVDLVIWNEDQGGYRQHVQDLIMGIIASGIEANLIDRPGGIFVRPAQHLSREDRVLMQAVARIVLADSRGTLYEQVHRRRAETVRPRFEPTASRQPESPQSAWPAPERALILANPYGGFSADGSEYVMRLLPGAPTPAPWANVLANPGFGTVISESGGAYTWHENAHGFRLTPWHNDPVSDASGEALYLRDEETGHYWSPTPLPRRGSGDYVTRHGFGYSVFEHVEEGIHSELWVYVALDMPVKFSVLKVRNASGRARRLSATAYVEWVLGDLREKSAMHVVTESDSGTGALLASNAYSIEFPGRAAFLDVDASARSVSGDRAEFLGRNGSLRAPAALSQARLSGRTGAGMDPCGAMQVAFDLEDGDDREIVFRLGAERDAGAATQLLQRVRGQAAAAEALAAVRAHWRDTLGRVQVRTPEPAVDVLVNGWLMYQIIACRFWARSGYYQSGGAFGFRDQLQDTMAMVHAAPQSTRQHLLLCAAHQFPQGDVQHWWHPPQDRGVRTACSDDYLWLALATSRYVAITGDFGVLHEQVGYIEGRPLNAGEESYYDLPARSPLSETLYQHCVRAIEHGMARGAHGLPLIGCGDWNDGMNLVGAEGKGESVWLGFFLYDILRQFAGTALLHGDADYAARCEEQAKLLQDSLQAQGWDGEWYRRAYFDDGTPLGSASNDECRIDSISQSWSVLSGAAPDDRRRLAMASLDGKLVRRDLGLIQLLDPPFDKSALEPGYIKGYVPGVRENGGQYTHAAVWATMAFAALGDSARAWELMRMINPVNHGDSAHAIEIYKVEPYVMAADVYGVDPHAGRGGWSWYTGSAGWMYRLVVESLLGLQVAGDRLRLDAVLPAEWEECEMTYRYRETDYRIVFRLAGADAGGARILLDGAVQPGPDVGLVNDGTAHRIEVFRPLGR
jgi:cellobiose phosphorylase